MADLVCPISPGIDHTDARNMFNQVKREMPKLSQAAWRREAARRMNTDYDTFLKAWKKPGPTVNPMPSPGPVKDTIKFGTSEKSGRTYAVVNDQEYIFFSKADPWMAPADFRWTASNRGVKISGKTRKEVLDKMIVDLRKRGFLNDAAPAPLPSPVLPKPPPTPTVKTLTHDEARLVYKIVKIENPGLTDAQIRREAAQRLGVPYDDYLKAWKKPKGAEPDPVPTPSPSLPGPQSKPPVAKPSNTPWPTKQEVKWTGTPAKEFKLEPYFGRDPGGNSHFTWRVVDQDGATRGDVLRIPRVQGDAVYRFKFPGGQVANTKEIMFKTRKELDDFLEGYLRRGELPDYIRVNPQWQVVANTTKNCTSCTSSWELRQRGLSVKSVKMIDGRPLQEVYQRWGITSKNQLGSVGKDVPDYMGNIPWSITNDDFLKKVATLPDGARGFLTVEWKTGGSHILNWEIRKGELWYIDAQPGYEGSAKTLEAFKNTGGSWGRGTPLDRNTGVVWAARVDNLDLPDPDQLDGWLTQTSVTKQEMSKWY